MDGHISPSETNDFGDSDTDIAWCSAESDREQFGEGDVDTSGNCCEVNLLIFSRGFSAIPVR